MTRLTLAPGRLEVDGAAQVVLCSSVFPFRLPPRTWENRLRLVRDSGYRMVDVYVHWGFHEPTEGSIDLTSPERDLAHFLELCDRHGLLVMARPGPYICSETDGGGLPPWLHGDRGGRGRIPLRGTHPEYLAAVDRWFDAVMPVLAAAQTTRGGPVALVQIENELDFFDCEDAPAYMTHLAERARARGIEVPIIACAGQGDAAGATGEAPGVVPTFNLYPDDRTSFLEPEVRHYAEQVAGRYPLMVTETNRLHRTLRREILGGARLVAPYLQSGGFNHLVAPSAGNWGDPGNLMTYDYDFGGYVTPDGRRTAEYAEAQRLSRTLTAWGERLASADPIAIEHVPLASADGLRALPGGALALPGGGHVIGPVELSGIDRRVTIGGEGSPGAGPLVGTVPAWSCPFWCLEVPLDPWGRDALLSASAELTEVRVEDDTLHLVLIGTADAEVRVTAHDGSLLACRHGPGVAEGRCTSGPVHVEIRAEEPCAGDPEPTWRPVPFSVTPLHLPAGSPLIGAGSPGTVSAPAPQAETLGVSEGRLRCRTRLRGGARELLLLGAADLVRLDVDGTDEGLAAPHGGAMTRGLDPAMPHDVSITAEIWGHANFDDSRLPGLAIGSGRGPGRVLAISEIRDVSALWAVTSAPTSHEAVDRAHPPVRGLGGWSSTELGRSTTYARTLGLTMTDVTGSPRGTSGPGASVRPVAALRLPGLREPVRVSIDGGSPTLLTPRSNVLALPARAPAVDVSVDAPHTPDGFCDGAELLLGFEPLDWEVEVVSPDALATAVATPVDHTLPEVSSTLHIEPGRSVLVRARIPRPRSDAGLLLELEGSDAQLTVFHAGRQVSRHVLSSSIAVAGGNPRRSWLPAAWIQDTAMVAHEVLVDILAEATGPLGGSVESVRWAPAPS